MKRSIVDIELRTVIDRNGEKEMSIVKQTGEYIKKNEVEILTFTEQRDDIGSIRNYITIQNNRVTIRRSGAISMNQKFEVGKKSESLYRHPYGTLHFQIETKTLKRKKRMKHKLGEIVITYKAVINGIEEQNHHLTLTFMKE